MADVNVRLNEGCAPEPQLLWDTVWNVEEGRGDWALAGPTETLNRGGLKATQALETAVIICLWTDLYCPPDHPLAKYVDPHDRRGWWGDGLDVRTDLGERSLGSLLWVLERGIIHEVATPRWAVSFAIDALSPLVACGAVARTDAQAFVSKSPNRLDLAVQLYGQDGAKIYDRRFDDVWAQVGRGS